MKYLNKLFAFDDRSSSQQQQSAPTPRLTSTLYSVTFVAESNQLSCRETPSSLLEDQSNPSHNNSGVTIVAHSASPGGATDCCRGLACGGQILNYSERLYPTTKTVSSNNTAIDNKLPGRERLTSQEGIREASSLGGYLLTATIGKTTASTSALANQDTIADQLIEEDDWILIEANSKTAVCCGNRAKQIEPITIKKSQMALDMSDVELIKASWEPVRSEPGPSGLLLFKCLFTKFPQYLKFFPQFSDLDLERMQENKRLLKHAIKVIETVTFVADSVGDESKTSKLNEALENLVKSHLKRNIGLAEFRNLGIVLIDFICDVNLSRSRRARKETKIDTNALVAAWTKLYSSILDLVKREEMKALA